MSSEFDSEILAAARGRPVERELALKRLFDSMRSSVLAVSLHLTGSNADAEDVLQDTFIAVFTQLTEFQGRSSLKTWVLQIAINLSLKRRHLRPQSVELSHADDVAHQNPTPDIAVSGRQEAERFMAAMAKLSDEQRTVLTLFSIDDLSHQTIAETLEIPEGTVWSRLHSARKRLQELLAE